MSSFVTPRGVIRTAHIFRPFATPVGSIWYADIAFPDGWADIVSNGPLNGLYRFVAVAPPSIYDAKGRALTLAGELGKGSLVRIAGNRLEAGGRTVLTMKAVSVVEMVEPENPFRAHDEIESVI
jgi:hypothetical protein